MWVDPAQFFPGILLIVSPHMDDEALACGSTIAQLPDKERIHLVYATDGMKSPAPVLPHDAITPDLGAVRRQESVAAMAHLGVPAANLHFLNLPEAELPAHLPALRAGLAAQITAVQPDHILLPFRYDRHPDHLAVHQVIMALWQQGQTQAALTEYFVYYRWRLLPRRDVRQYIAPSLLAWVDGQAVVAQKRAALACFRSQTTICYPWQTRPILTAALLDETSATPEQFLRYDSTLPGTAVFTPTYMLPWIRFVHRWESPLQKRKYVLGVWLKRGLRR